jgi:hypothetical protein
MASVPDDTDSDLRSLQQIKQKYQELQNLRVHSVKQDIDDLRKKIAEHRRIHDISVQELRMQNDDLKKKLRVLMENDHETDQLRDRVRHLRDDLCARDPVLAVFLRQPGFAVRVAAKRSFEIRAGDRDQLVFTLSLTGAVGRGDDLRFHFIEYPPEMARNPDTKFVKSNGTFRSADLQALCDHLRKGLEVAGIWKRQSFSDRLGE